MTTTSDVKLSRNEGQPWGFRLSGGVDYTFPLTAVRVAIGGPADTAGLQAGDVIVKLNGELISQLTHAQVHDKLVSAGNDFVLSVMRDHEIVRQENNNNEHNNHNDSAYRFFPASCRRATL